MSRQSEYSKKLRDPRWQRRRLEILERDEWACQMCEATTKTLHVHHKWYEGEPWDAPDEALLTVCEDCHRDEYECRGDMEHELLRVLRRHYCWYELDWLRGVFEEMPTDVAQAFASGYVRDDATGATEEWLRARREKFDEWSRSYGGI